jgi:hypothetical protein
MIQINGREIFQKERVDKELSREPATGLNEAFGQLDAKGWNQGSSYSGCSYGRVWEARVARLAEPDDSEVIVDCDLETEPDLQKIGKGGARSRKGNRPFGFLRYRC